LAVALAPYFAAAGVQADPAMLEPIVPLIQERITTFEDAPPLAAFFFRAAVDCSSADLLVKEKTAGESAAILQRAHALLAALPAMEHSAANAALTALAAELALKPGQLFSPLRMAVTGQKVSPPLFETMELLGRDVVLARIAAAAQQLRAA
jgi:glutamyl-tRNA synthetase